MYGFPAISSRRSKWVPQSSGRETTAEPSSNLIALTRIRRGGCSRPRFHRYSFRTSSMKIRSGFRCCCTCSRIALIARGVRSVREAAQAARKGITMMRSSSCSAMSSRLQLVPPPGAFLRVAGEAALRALDDPGGDAAVRLDRPQESELLDLDVPLAGDHALQDLPEGRVVDHPLHATALRERDELVLDVLLQLGVREFDSAEPLPRLGRQDLTEDLLPLGLLRFPVLLLGLGLHLGLLQLRHLPPADRVELVLVHRHGLTGLRRIS